MNYELALKLKESGFPQDTCSIVVRKIHPDPVEGDIMASRIMAPTLSELIEACKENINVIKKPDNRWIAMKLSDPHEGAKDVTVEYAGTGEQLEEAVANFWLALNKKS